MGEQELKDTVVQITWESVLNLFYTKYVFTNECGHFSDLVVWQIDSFQAGNQVHWLRNCKSDKQLNKI